VLIISGLDLDAPYEPVDAPAKVCPESIGDDEADDTHHLLDDHIAWHLACSGAEGTYT
jgi:hypothetical protein